MAQGHQNRWLKAVTGVLFVLVQGEFLFNELTGKEVASQE